jgi:hypothetical protein
LITLVESVLSIDTLSKAKRDLDGLCELVFSQKKPKIEDLIKKLDVVELLTF